MHGVKTLDIYRLVNFCSFLITKLEPIRLLLVLPEDATQNLINFYVLYKGGKREGVGGGLGVSGGFCFMLEAIFLVSSTTGVFS